MARRTRDELTSAEEATAEETRDDTWSPPDRYGWQIEQDRYERWLDEINGSR